MKPINYKWPEIDLLKLMQVEDGEKIWNFWLAKCLKQQDVRDLERVFYGIQRGMNSLVDKKMNSQGVVTLFLRMQKSIEDTAKAIYRKKYPNPCDDPLGAKNNMDWYERKKKRDHEFELWLRRARF